MAIATRRFTIVKLFLVLLNVASTALTLFTGLRENPLLVAVTGRYDSIRQRLRDGSINTEMALDDNFRIEKLSSLDDISEYRFITAPRRDPYSIGEYRSVCTNLNSNTAPVMGLVYDDFWGNGTRRVQVFVYSISAPKCKMINVKPKWRDSCIQKFNKNATQCYQYILDNFETLQEDRLIQVGANKDFGERGVPFLKCLGRPQQNFDFQADLLAHQAYWAGGSYHIMIQTSECRAVSLIRNPDRKWGLFESRGIDEGANVLLALPPAGWFASTVTFLYSVVTITMIAKGVVAALMRNRNVHYLPKQVRYEGTTQKVIQYVLPFMPVAIFFTEHERSIIRFKGSLLIASDIWMNHWLYMVLSILDAITNIRLTYVTLQVGTWMLVMKITTESFLFLCGALTKITWIMCLVATMLRYFLKVFARVVRAMRLIKSSTRQRIEWYVDSSAMFLTYKLYNLMLCVILGLMLNFRGAPTFMERADPYKVGMYGGIPRIAQFWKSEIVCDLLTILTILTGCGQVVGMLLLCTRYRHVASNNVMRLLQKRYMISGWDGLMAAQMLGLDTTDPELLVAGRPQTKVDIGSLLQLMYLSGPSGFVQLAGDYIFTGNGFSQEPVKFEYPVHRAYAMGLIQDTKNSAFSYKAGAAYTVSDSVGESHASMIGKTVAQSARIGSQPTIAESEMAEFSSGAVADRTSSMPSVKTSIFDRNLRVVSDGYLGKLLLIDEKNPGSLVSNKETGIREFVVTDALTTMSILDIRWLLGNDKKLRAA